ncbi:MAG: hypothetical protein K6C08_01540 [Oscillospiraceae bacterium]|nr:hypothetical protein [Oscillospiraceae bacterium]
MIRNDPFFPSLWEYRGLHKDNAAIRRYRYGDFSLVWTTRYLSQSDCIELALSYSSRDDCQASDLELEGFFREMCFDSSLRVSCDERQSSSSGEFIRIYRQELPEQPIISKKDLWQYSDEEKKKLMSYLSEANVLETVDASAIRSRLKLSDKLSDDVIILQAHRKLARMPFVRGSRRIRSARWLHDHGQTVTTPKSS